MLERRHRQLIRRIKMLNHIWNLRLLCTVNFFNKLHEAASDLLGNCKCSCKIHVI